MVAPTTSYPASTSKAAATDESTPPDIATRTRSATTSPSPNAEFGMRNAEYKGRVESRNETRTAIPHSALRTPHSALASPVQDGGQLPDLLDNLWQGPDDRLHVLRRVLLAEREPQGGDAQLPRHAHGREYVRRLDRPRRARGTRGASDPREVEVHQQRLAVGTGNRHARDVGGPPAVSAVDHGVGHDGDQPALELVAQRGRTGGERRLLAGRQLHGRPEPHDPRHVLRARPDTELLAAAVDDRFDGVAIPHDQGSDALGGADLVAGDGEERAGDVV